MPFLKHILHNNINFLIYHPKLFIFFLKMFDLKDMMSLQGVMEEFIAANS